MMRFFILVCATGVLLHADGPGVTTAFSPPLMNGIIGQQSMAYNSTDNQYCLVWLDEAGFNNINCALYNPDGTPASAQTSLSNAAQSPYICYNSTNNQYFIAWVANDNIQFIVIDNATNIVVPVQSIPLSAGLFAGADVTCCYNSVSNEYCITWIEWDGATPPSQLYFALVDATGAVVKGETEISSGAGLAAGDALTPFVTYNSRKNEYFFTWFGTDGTNNYLLFALYDAGGNAITSAQVIPQFTGYGLSGNTPFSCYNTVTNQYFVTWVASPPTLGQAYPFYAIYNSSGGVVVPTTAVTPQ